MSVLDVFSFFESNAIYLLVYTIALPVLPLLLRLMHGPLHGSLAPWKYLYSVVIYLSCIPGVFTLFALLYLTTFQRENLLALDIITYLLPVLSMIVTLVVIRGNVSFDDIPGFQRIAGLIALTVGTFIVLLVLDRLHIFLFFRASIIWFFVIGAGVFIGLMLGGKLLFGRRRGR